MIIRFSNCQIIRLETGKEGNGARQSARRTNGLGRDFPIFSAFSDIQFCVTWASSIERLRDCVSARGCPFRSSHGGQGGAAGSSQSGTEFPNGKEISDLIGNSSDGLRVGRQWFAQARVGYAPIFSSKNIMGVSGKFADNGCPSTVLWTPGRLPSPPRVGFLPRDVRSAKHGGLRRA